MSSSNNKINIKDHRLINDEEGHKIKVNLVENGAIHGSANLFLRVLTPQSMNSGCKERLHILLTGQFRGNQYVLKHKEIN